MKTRLGFVSNSSSASFVVSLHKLSAMDYIAIKNYLCSNDNTDGWSCREDLEAGLLTGYTIMDNCAFSEWLEQNNINIVRFGE